MFWGLKLQNQEIKALNSNTLQQIHISHATLVKSNCLEENILIELQEEENRFIIGVFSKSGANFLNLDYFLNLNKNSNYNIKLVHGESSEVHLTGYIANLAKESGLLLENHEKHSDHVDDNENEYDNLVDNDKIQKFLKRKTFIERDFDARPKKLKKLKNHGKTLKNGNNGKSNHKNKKD